MNRLGFDEPSATKAVNHSATLGQGWSHALPVLAAGTFFLAPVQNKGRQLALAAQELL